MKNKKKIFYMTVILSLCAVLPMNMSTRNAAYSADKIHFAIVFAGGPDPQGEGKNILNQFLDNLSRMTGISASRLTGQYFNRLSTAKRYISRNRNCFIMGSIGFYAENKNRFGLVPLTKVSMQGSDREQYFLLVKKGRYKNLKQMRGKKISGNVLYENKRFLSRIIFANKVNVASFFKLKPTQRPLTAVRRLTRNRIDGVLLNRMQYNSLKKLSLFQRVSVVYTSPSLPALGLMMVNTPVNAAVKNKIVSAITGMCSLQDGKKVCSNFGIQGFKSVSAGEVESALSSY